VQCAVAGVGGRNQAGPNNQARHESGSGVQRHGRPGRSLSQASGGEPAQDQHGRQELLQGSRAQTHAQP